MTEGQRLAVEQLREIERTSEGTLEVISTGQTTAIPPWTRIEISVACKHLPEVPRGLPLRDRERFIILVPADFPFVRPEVFTPHTRFAGFPHVQWKISLCLYQAPAVEWNPNNGMFGFIERLESWLRCAAMDQLDPVGGPLHPPVTYLPSGPVHTVVPRVDAPPTIGGQTWFGAAHLKVVSPTRVDVVGWSPILASDTPNNVAAAILLAEPMPFEFPSNCSDLFQELIARGVPTNLLFLTLQAALLRNDESMGLYVLIGAPMRGIRGSGALRQHLTAWYVEPVITGALRIAVSKYSSHEELKQIGEKAEQIVMEWAKTAKVHWCAVREDRSEIVTRRDDATPMSWFKERTVALWGCGALGGHLAEFLTRAGVKKLILRDHGVVAPGLLARQPFEDLDIGKRKVHALAERLKRIRPELEIEAHDKNILNEPLNSEDWTDGADVIVESTGINAVLQKLELKRAGAGPVLVSMVIGHEARDGVAVLASPTHSGGPYDVFRRAKLAICNRPHLQHYADEFWPETPRQGFQPEPGCSDPTFVGSAADIASLAGMMLNHVARDLAAPGSATAFVHFVTQPPSPSMAARPVCPGFSWEPDRLCRDPQSGYEIRIDAAAWSEMRAWSERSRRTGGELTETGGLLFGELNDAVRTVWVTEVIGPPPDSRASAAGFVCGTAGTLETNLEKRVRSRGSVQYIGMWHTHPWSAPVPSDTDMAGMAQIVLDGNTPPKSLMLILGTLNGHPAVGAYLFSRSDIQQIKAEEVRLCSIHVTPSAEKPRRIGLALSGGGSRAIAFHLGCLRALHDRGILGQLEVISAVSGGAVIAGMYGYGSDPFEEFDARVVRLLRRGLTGGILRRALCSPRLLQSSGTAALAGMLALGADGLRTGLGIGTGVLSAQGRVRADWIDRIQPPLRRWVSRTTAFEDILREQVFADTRLTSPRRGGIEVVFNACELRTGSAFRFGSRESGCWRFGRIADNEQIRVAHAVAASAAYPVLLPAIDESLTFISRQQNQSRQRVILTDGGIFDNLGVSSLQPGRSEEFSSNVFHPDYIICCNAGLGLFSDHARPYWWATRMVRSFESVFRKTGDATHDRLHRFAELGHLKGFILSYLGQRDDKLPHIPPDLVRREEVFDYPTDFSPMNPKDIELLTSRGEQLTRLLIARYCPEL